MTTPEIIAACAKSSGLPFLIIGGHAVIAHGYSRNTVDLDFLVRKSDREVWSRAVVSLGFEPFHLHENFAQFRSSGRIDLDLMFVNGATFDGIFAASKPVSFGPISARVPSLEHLVALKLHVLKQNLPHRTFGDLDDVINLVTLNRVNLREEKWRKIFEKYGNLDLYERICRVAQP